MPSIEKGGGSIEAWLQQPRMDSRVYEMELGGGLLASVSRSFYLSIKVLPRPVRRVIALGYLLARASDTIADSSHVPAQSRLANLAAFRRMVLERSGGGLPHLFDPMHPGERLLLKRLPECLNWLELLGQGDRADICAVLDDIIHGQELDVQRFSEPGKLVSLREASELEEYTYLVAGCVGRFWTRISLRHLKRYSDMEPEALCQLGVNFGKGLQLVNILRDLPADLRAGRCYLPINPPIGSAEELAAAPQLARPEFERWLRQAEAWLGDGYRYIEAIHPLRSRFACILPWKIGTETLALLRKTPPLETPVRVKVPRTDVRKIMFRAILAAFSNRRLGNLR